MSYVNYEKLAQKNNTNIDNVRCKYCVYMNDCNYCTLHRTPVFPCEACNKFVFSNRRMNHETI